MKTTKLTSLINEYFDLKKGQHIIISAEPDAEEHFSTYGCEIIRPLASAVYDATYVIFKFGKSGDYVELDRGDIRVSFPVLDAMANGTEYYINNRGDAIPDFDADDEMKGSAK